MKTVAAKQYTEVELAIFAKWRDVRRTVQPTACTGGMRCWVEFGPPCCTPVPGSMPLCVECRSSLKTRRTSSYQTQNR